MRRLFFPVLLVWIIFLGMMLPRGFAAVLGQMVFGAGRGWDGSWVRNPDVMYNGSFMMWYDGSNLTSATPNIGLATSSDGISWTRYSHNPVFKGSRGELWDSWDVEYPWVIYENGVYKMWYSGQPFAGTGFADEQIGYATSPDGINWTRYSGNPVLGPSRGLWDGLSVYDPRVVHSGSTYLMYYEGTSSSNDYGIGLATSKDGIHWTKNEQPSIPLGGWDSSGHRMGSVENLNGTFVAVYSGSGNGTAFGSIGIASSQDGISWKPFTGNPIITSRGGSFPCTIWDCLGVFSPMMVAVGNSYYVYFTALSDNSQNYVVTNIGLAILPMTSVPIPEFPFTQLMLVTSMGILVLCFRVKRNHA
jgi:predicted GH43/DUF377 family glycosyl hydrolase